MDNMKINSSAILIRLKIATFKRTRIAKDRRKFLIPYNCKLKGNQYKSFTCKVKQYNQSIKDRNIQKSEVLEVAIQFQIIRWMSRRFKLFTKTIIWIKLTKKTLLKGVVLKSINQRINFEVHTSKNILCKMMNVAKFRMFLKDR